MPQPGWLIHSRILLFTVRRREAQGQRPSMVTSWRGLSSWLPAGGCLLPVPSPGGRRQGALPPLPKGLKGADPLRTPAPVITRSGHRDSPRCRAPGTWTLRMYLGRSGQWRWSEGHMASLLPHLLHLRTKLSKRQGTGSCCHISQLVPLWHFDTSSLIFSLNTSPLFSTAFQNHLLTFICLTYTLNIL